MQTTNDPFVIVGLQPWYTPIGSNCKHIAKTLSLTNKVLYVNASLDRRHILLRNSDPNVEKHLQIAKLGKGQIREVEPNLWEYYPPTILESINWIPNTRIFQKFNYINNKRLANDIKEAITQMGFSNYILFNDNEIFRAFFLQELLKPKSYIYYCRDYLLGVDYWKRHGTKIEPLHIENADLAMANSAYLADYLKKYNPNSFDIGQGCDTDLFNGKNNYTIPDDVAKINGKRIGYVGALNSLRLDINCLIYIAKQRSDWQIILVGPEDEDFKKSELHQLSNVHFLGQKPLDSLPTYIAGFDVCLNPQLINNVTIGNYPLKIDEYLNMGKPVVATSTRAMDLFKSHAYLADSINEYVPLIEKALKEDSEQMKQERIDFAKLHTWKNSVGKLFNAIGNT